MSHYLNPLIEEAYCVLEGKPLPQELALRLAKEIHGCDILDLVSLANKVRCQNVPEFLACSIINAKSGLCAQNCRFCAQGAAYDTHIRCYPLVDEATMLEAAKKAYEAGVRAFGVVTSGWGFQSVTSEFQDVLARIDALRAHYSDLKICASLGILSEETARLLAEHGVWRYNMNLQTNPERYGDLITTNHSIEEKIATIKFLQKYHVTICCGGIIGLGETWEDRVKLAYAVRDLHVEGSPLNVLLPIPGTPCGNNDILSPADVAKAFAIHRLINPTLVIKFAAGRETTMKDFQGLLMLAGMNAIITGGYLTTRGRTVAEDDKLLEDLRQFGK